MAWTAHKSEEAMIEHFDAPEEFQQKMDMLASMVSNSKHFVVFTGAGVG